MNILIFGLVLGLSFEELFDFLFLYCKDSSGFFRIDGLVSEASD